MPQPKQKQQQKHSSSSSATSPSATSSPGTNSAAIIAKRERERERKQTIGETDMDQSVLNGLPVGGDPTVGYHGHKRELGHRWAVLLRETGSIKAKALVRERDGGRT